jgi:hypothetical protein
MTDTPTTAVPLPCHSLAQAAIHARRPFIPELVRAKIHTAGETWAEIAYYLDARAVIDRLNLIVPGAWEPHFEPLAAIEHEGERSTLVYRCRLRVLGVVFTDVGEGVDHKAAHSDALKRAAVHLGIGHCVYRITGPRMGVGAGPHQLRRSRRGRPYLDDANREWLRSRYRQWLIGEGVAEYGLPLDHGQAARALAPDVFPAWSERRRPGVNGARRVPEGSNDAPTDGREPGQVPAGALAAVHGSADATPPATPPQRAALVEAARRCGYKIKTVELLARVACGAVLDRLTAAEVEAMGDYVKRLSAAVVNDARLRARLEEIRASDDTTPEQGLNAWLAELDRPAAAA